MCSKFRREGKTDVIQTFAPDRMHGANEPRFRSFINQCLGNRHSTLYTKFLKRPLSNPRNLPFEADSEYGASDEFCHSNSEYLRQLGWLRRERDEQRFRLEEFVRLGEGSIPGLRRFMEALEVAGTWEATTKSIGRKHCEFSRRSVRQLAMRMV